MANFFELSTFYKHLNQNLLPDRHVIGHFNVFRVEDLLLPKSGTAGHGRRSFFKVSLITGHSKVQLADHTVEANGTLLLFTNPIIPFFWERVGSGHTGYICVFTEDFFSRFGDIKDYPVFQSVGAGVIELSLAEAAPFEQLFARMRDELQSGYAYKYDLLRNLLMEVIHGAQKMQPATGIPLNGSNAYERITSLFAKLLDRQFPIELTSQAILIRSPADFARQLNIHVNHLNKALKDTTGYTTSQLINKRFLAEAKILLKTTNWTITEIASCLGFEEPNHFSSFFKSREHVTPKAFRRPADD